MNRIALALVAVLVAGTASAQPRNPEEAIARARTLGGMTAAITHLTTSCNLEANRQRYLLGFAPKVLVARDRAAPVDTTVLAHYETARRRLLDTIGRIYSPDGRREACDESMRFYEANVYTVLGWYFETEPLP